MSTNALLLEIFISAFFAIACFRFRGAVPSSQVAMRARDLPMLRKPARSTTR